MTTEDNGWILWGGKRTEDIAAYERVQEKYERNGRHCLERALRCL